MNIGYLDFQTAASLSRSSRFHHLVAEIGGSISSVSLQDLKIGESADHKLSEWDHLVDRSDVFFLDGSKLIKDRAKLTNIVEAIKRGTSLLVDVDPNHLDAINPILAHFDLIATSLRLANPPGVGSPRMPKLRREEDCLRHLELFAEVDELLIQQPGVITYSGRAIPIVVACDAQIVVDRGDLLTTDDPRQCACIAGWCGKYGQVVLVVYGNVLGDPYTSADGVKRPGIEANERFARNLIGYLSRRTSSQAPRLEDGNSLCDRIEQGLGRFVLDMLQAQNDHRDWWTDHVPLKIRQKCVDRREEERNQYPPEAYFDLVDLKEIMKANWPIFEGCFVGVGLSRQKKESLGWITELNSKYRRQAAHPLKRLLTGFSYSPADLDFLGRWDEKVAELLRATQGP